MKATINTRTPSVVDQSLRPVTTSPIGGFTAHNTTVIHGAAQLFRVNLESTYTTVATNAVYGLWLPPSGKKLCLLSGGVILKTNVTVTGGAGTITFQLQIGATGAGKWFSTAGPLTLTAGSYNIASNSFIFGMDFDPAVNGATGLDPAAGSADILNNGQLFYTTASTPITMSATTSPVGTFTATIQTFLVGCFLD